MSQPTWTYSPCQRHSYARPDCSDTEKKWLGRISIPRTAKKTPIARLKFPGHSTPAPPHFNVGGVRGRAAAAGMGVFFAALDIPLVAPNVELRGRRGRLAPIRVIAWWEFISQCTVPKITRAAPRRPKKESKVATTPRADRRRPGADGADALGSGRCAHGRGSDWPKHARQKPAPVPGPQLWADWQRPRVATPGSEASPTTPPGLALLPRGAAGPRMALEGAPIGIYLYPATSRLYPAYIPAHIPLVFFLYPATFLLVKRDSSASLKEKGAGYRKNKTKKTGGIWPGI